MNEGEAIALQPLQDESLSTEETGSDLAGKCNLNLDARCGTKKCIFLADKGATQAAKVQCYNLAWIRGSKGDALFSLAAIHKGGNKEAFACNHPFETTK